MTPTMVNQQFFFFFFHRIIGCNELFSFWYGRGTTYLCETGRHHQKTSFCHTRTIKAQIRLRIHAVWSAPLLFEAWIVTRFYSAKLYSSTGTYTVSFAESVLSLPVHLFKSKFHAAGTVLQRCRFGGGGANLCHKKINDFVTFGTQIFDLWVSGHRNQSL